MVTTEPIQRAVSFDNRETRDDEMQTTVEEWISDLIADTEDAHNSEAFQQWLDIQRRFHDYSARNSLLMTIPNHNHHEHRVSRPISDHGHDLVHITE